MYVLMFVHICIYMYTAIGSCLVLLGKYFRQARALVHALTAAILQVRSSGMLTHCKPCLSILFKQYRSVPFPSNVSMGPMWPCTYQTLDVSAHKTILRLMILFRTGELWAATGPKDSFTVHAVHVTTRVVTCDRTLLRPDEWKKTKRWIQIQSCHKYDKFQLQDCNIAKFSWFRHKFGIHQKRRKE